MPWLIERGKRSVETQTHLIDNISSESKMLTLLNFLNVELADEFYRIL